MRHFTESIPPEKLVIGLGMGAQHWYTVADPALYYQGARSWSRGVRRHQVDSLLTAFDGPPLTWDGRQKMAFSYIERAGAFEWIVSDNDVRAFDAKLDLARRLGVRGISMWVNGDEEPGMWSRFRAKRIDGRTASPPATAMTGIPVFLWHYFADSITKDAGPLTETYSRFDELLRTMREQGFTSVFPEEARVARTGGGRQVILTFDDGRKEQLRAAGILEKHGFRGIFFVVPTRTRQASSAYLSSEDIARLARAGHRISVHGTDHRSLASSGSEASSSVAEAFRILDEATGVRPSAVEFAMPFGHYTPSVIDALASRYRYLMSVNPGYWDGASQMIPRMLIFHDVPLSLYREFLLGGGVFQPQLIPLTQDGAVADTVRFRVEGGPIPSALELLAVSADASGRSYKSHPLGDAASIRGDVLVLDLKKHRDRYFPADRNVIAYAIVTRTGDQMRYLSPGIMHWLTDPSTGPALRP
jgi:hypothetical protein